MESLTNHQSDPAWVRSIPLSADALSLNPGANVLYMDQGAALVSALLGDQQNGAGADAASLIWHTTGTH